MLSERNGNSRARLPGPRGADLVRSLLEVKRDRLGFVLRVARRYGDFVHFRIGRRSLVLVNDPVAAHGVLRDESKSFRKGIGLFEARAFLGDGLLTSEGDLWEAQRREVQHLFHADRLQGLSWRIVAAAEDLAKRWRSQAAGERLDIGREMEFLALDVFGRTLLRGDLLGEPGLVESFAALQRWAMRRMASPWGAGAPLVPRGFRSRHALRRLHAVADRLIAEHRSRSPGPDARDMLDLMLAGGRQVDAAAMRGEVLTLLLAGHDTSGSALAWVWVLLAAHPHVRDRLEAELRVVLGGRTPALTDLPRLVYTRMVVQETLRLFPPVWMLPRRAERDVEIGGYKIKAGSEVLISPYALHRHPSFWESPESFRPERFEPGGRSHPEMAYLPFGHGPRACLGSGFGMLEILLVVAATAQHFRLEPAPGFKARPEPLLSLRPRPGLWMYPRQVAA